MDGSEDIMEQAADKCVKSMDFRNGRGYISELVDA
jgi:hypothetical protein